MLITLSHLNRWLHTTNATRFSIVETIDAVKTPIDVKSSSLLLLHGGPTIVKKLTDVETCVDSF